LTVLAFEPYKELSVIITPFASDAVLKSFVELLLTKTNTKLKLNFVLPEGAQPRIFADKIDMIVLPAGSNYLAAAVKAAKYDQVLVVSQVALPYDQDWPELLSSHLRLPHVAVAAPLIIRHGQTIEDGGLVRYADGGLGPLFFNHPIGNHQTFFGNTDWVRNVDTLSGATVLARKKELAAYFKAGFKSTNFTKDMQAFCSQAVQKDAFALVLPQIMFDNYSIRIQPSQQQASHFNPNMLNVGNSFELYTNTSSALHILRQLHEEAGNDQ